MSDTTHAKPKHVPSTTKEKIVENIKSLGLALILVLAIRSSFIEAYKIPSGSMIPSLLVGDHIFVNKLAYGLKIPFTEWFGDPVYLIRGGYPKRGDIIVFKYPRDESLYYIKRVIGTPGDTVEVRGKRLFINGTAIETSNASPEEKDKTLNLIEDAQYNKASLDLVHEALGEHKPIIMTDKGGFITENYGPITVPPDMIFVMGDNRDHSNDSRFWGFVPMPNVKGRAVFIWLSAWVDFSAGSFTFRPSRIGTVLP